MRIPWKWLAVAVPVALLVACEQARTPTAARVATPTLAADYTNNLDNGNARIYRDTAFGLAVAWTDRSSPLRITAWTYNALDGCGTFDEIGGVHLQGIVPVDPADPIKVNAKGPVFIRVRDTSQPGDCFGNLLVASGWGTLKYNDNNFTGQPPQDSWSWSADGNLLTPTGRPVTVSGHVHFVCFVSGCKANGAQVNLRY